MKRENKNYIKIIINNQIKEISSKKHSLSRGKNENSWIINIKFNSNTIKYAKKK